jgi:2-haloacid dehalogenase
MSSVRNIVFDCNETILDLATITPVFQRLFASPGAMRLWFQELITYSQALTIADVYVPFTDIGAAVLQKIAAPGGLKSPRPTVRSSPIGSPPCPRIPRYRALCGG